MKKSAGFTLIEELPPYAEAPYKGRSIFLESLMVKNAGQVPLAADLTWTQDGGNDFYNNTSPTALDVGPFPSNHLSGSKPKGGNTLFGDSHVEWMPFSDMVMRYKSTWQNMEHYW